MTKIGEHKAARLCPCCGGDSYVRCGYDRMDGVFVRTRVCKECQTMFDTLELLSGYVRKKPLYTKDKRQKKCYGKHENE